MEKDCTISMEAFKNISTQHDMLLGCYSVTALPTCSETNPSYS